MHTQILRFHLRDTTLVGVRWDSGAQYFNITFPDSVLRAKKFWCFNSVRLKIAEADAAGPSPEELVYLLSVF